MWKDLSMKDKASYIRMGVENGITDLGTIREIYNKFAEGGELKNKYPTINPSKVPPFLRNITRYFNRTSKNIGETIDEAKTYIKQKQNTLNKFIDNIPTTEDDIRLNIYNNINPNSGYDNPVERIIGAITGMKSDNMWNRDPVTDAAFATYLNIPNNKRKYHTELSKSKYRPTKGNTIGEVYRLPLENNDFDKGMIIKSANNVKIGESKAANYLPITGADILGNYTVSRGIDNKGEYVSYYDTYDLNPFKGFFAKRAGNKAPGFIQNIEDLSLGLGTPFTLYDRIYLDDYYGVKTSLPKDSYYGGYLPEVVITPDHKHAEGGPIKKSLEGILYKDGGYKPSSRIKKQIADWEGSSMKTNRSFEAEARDFNASLPKGATSKLTQEQLDGLYSYSYNVGAGNFRKRVNPALTRYLTGIGTIQDVQRSMWASKDSQLRGLAKRRNAERAMLGSYTPMDFGPLSSTTTMMINQYLPESKPIEIPQLIFNRDFSDIQPTEPIETSSYEVPEVDYNNSAREITGLLDMMQMIKSPRKINIYT